MYPDLTPKEREYKIVKEKGAVFLMQVGKKLTNGERHDGRAPDYDDWELNGDILVYYPVLDIALELSSMGIRVDETALDLSLIHIYQFVRCWMRYCFIRKIILIIFQSPVLISTAE